MQAARKARRPHMPGYGTLPESEGGGLLPWDWAAERLSSSRNFWLSSNGPTGRPHVMPVWAIWHDGSLWLSSSRRSRKARNLVTDPRCTITTEDAANPVVVEARAELVTDVGQLDVMLRLTNEKYGTDYGPELLDPTVNSPFRLWPVWVFGLRSEDFTGSPTVWEIAENA